MAYLFRPLTVDVKALERIAAVKRGEPKYHVYQCRSVAAVADQLHAADCRMIAEQLAALHRDASSDRNSTLTAVVQITAEGEDMATVKIEAPKERPPVWNALAESLWHSLYAFDRRPESV